MIPLVLGGEALLADNRRELLRRAERERLAFAVAASRSASGAAGVTAAFRSLARRAAVTASTLADQASLPAPAGAACATCP